MADYVLPTFNLTCNLYTSGNHSVSPRLSSVPCNLAWGRRVSGMSTGGTTSVGVPLVTMTLLLPTGTDVRGQYSSSGSDAVEVPSGSGRFYTVIQADYIGKGFPNEHQGAVIMQTPGFKTPDT